MKADMEVTVAEAGVVTTEPNAPAAVSEGADGAPAAVSTVALAAAEERRPRPSVGATLLFGFIFIYLALPMIAVVLYSFATSWQAKILPDGYTLDWWRSALSDSTVRGAIWTSLVLATLAATLDIMLVVPAAYWARVRNRRIRPFIEVSAAIPFALPYLVIAFGLLEFSGEVAPKLQGTFPLLVFGHAAICFPFVYWAVDAAMAGANVERLTEAAETCGAKPWTILRRVVFPNITPGVVTGALLAFAASFGEFAMVQIMGGGTVTIPIWSAQQIRSYTGQSGSFNRLAVITVITFIVLFVISGIVVYRNRSQQVRLLPGAGSQKG
jgi:putative spermidine/putrescine transport system permease protein